MRRRPRSRGGGSGCEWVTRGAPPRGAGRALSAWRRCRVRVSSLPGRSEGMCGAPRRPTEGGNLNLTAVLAPGFAPAPCAVREGAPSGGGLRWAFLVPVEGFPSFPGV